MGAYFTYRQVMNSREQLAHSREQLQIAQQGQITERFTCVIDQLGHAQLDVRLGGIYALERIARDSPAGRATIGEVLTAFVRSHAPWPPRLPDQPEAATQIEEVPELQVRAADVQACLTVLSRGGFPWGQRAEATDLTCTRSICGTQTFTARTWSGHTWTAQICAGRSLTNVPPGPRGLERSSPLPVT